MAADVCGGKAAMPEYRPFPPFTKVEKWEKLRS